MDAEVSIGAGLALIAGAGTRIAALALAFFTLVASFFFDAYWSVPAGRRRGGHERQRYARSKRSAFMTFVQAATKSCTNFSRLSSCA